MDKWEKVSQDALHLFNYREGREGEREMSSF